MALTHKETVQLLPLAEQGDTRSIGKLLRKMLTEQVQELTVSGVVTPGVAAVELNHATVVVAATIADLKDHQGFLIVKNTSASGTAAHTVTVTTGTWNGTNKIITLDAPNEAIAFWIDSAGNGTILENVGSVAISGT